MSLIEPSLKTDDREFGYHKACVECPASLVCLTMEVHNVYDDGEIHYWKGKPIGSISFRQIHFHADFSHCPFVVIVERG